MNVSTGPLELVSNASQCWRVDRESEEPGGAVEECVSLVCLGLIWLLGDLSARRISACHWAGVAAHRGAQTPALVPGQGWHWCFCHMGGQKGKGLKCVLCAKHQRSHKPVQLLYASRILLAFLCSCLCLVQVSYITVSILACQDFQKFDSLTDSSDLGLSM